ncbi:MAG: hypothetical protein RL514_4346 [Verrucomicrobiota bacterium]|jgi:hypothetical protein
MDSHPQSQPMPNGSEPFRTVPQTSESFGKVPHATESFGNLPNTSERTDNHTLTVREVARMFEAAGVARTERSIVNWCQPNRQGIARLDSYFDMNERKYFITQESVKLATQEELAKMSKAGEPARTEPFPNDAENQTRAKIPADEAKVLRQEVMDLKITNRAKDMFIEQLRSERQSFADERSEFVQRLIVANRKMGELESDLRRIEQPPMSFS